jgi:ferredoxin
MAWEKVVQIVAVSACPKCSNQAFDLEPGTEMDDPQGLVKCGQCGYVCPGNEFMKPVDSADKKSAN